MSIRGACQVFSISRTVYRYQPDETRDGPVIKALQELAERYPRPDTSVQLGEVTDYE